LKTIEEEFYTNDITKTPKKKFLNKQKESTKRITKLKNEAKKKFDQKRRKSNLFLS
jgi:translation elongation factor EF-4